jgi:hypothetical protein
MRFLNIERRMVTVQLTPEDCFLISLACCGAYQEPDAASLASQSGADPERALTAIEAIGSAFEVAAMAGGLDSRWPKYSKGDPDMPSLADMRAGSLLDRIA